MPRFLVLATYCSIHFIFCPLYSLFSITTTQYHDSLKEMSTFFSKSKQDDLISRIKHCFFLTEAFSMQITLISWYSNNTCHFSGTINPNRIIPRQPLLMCVPANALSFLAERRKFSSRITGK